MEKLKIKKIEFLYEKQPNRREVKVTLNNGTKIHIVKCYESWEQFGGTIDELRVTVPIAEKYNGWLHGGKKHLTEN